MNGHRDLANGIAGDVLRDCRRGVHLEQALHVAGLHHLNPETQVGVLIAVGSALRRSRSVELLAADTREQASAASKTSPRAEPRPPGGGPTEELVR